MHSLYMLQHYTAVARLSTIWSHPIWPAAWWIKGFSKLTVVIWKVNVWRVSVLSLLRRVVSHTHNALAQKSCCPLACSVFFHTWLAERGKGENAPSSTDLHSWVRNVSSVIGLKEFIKVPGFGIGIDYNVWERRRQSRLSGWSTGTITQNQY